MMQNYNFLRNFALNKIQVYQHLINMLLFPNAKINIGLDILNKRSDGYHNISTIMVPVMWQDILEIVPSATEETKFHLYGRPINCPPEKNLVMKAYRALCSRIPDIQSVPIDIELLKKIPDGAGLGGGSADAAFMLKNLNLYFALGLSDEYLAEIAAEIGADCPFFIYNRPMLAEGIGDNLTPVDISFNGLYITIVKPDFSIPTAEAYANIVPATPATPLSECHDLHTLLAIAKNDFEAPLARKYPLIAEIKNTLINEGAIYASLSGSGSAVYGLFDSEEKCRHATDKFDSLCTFCGIL